MFIKFIQEFSKFLKTINYIYLKKSDIYRILRGQFFLILITQKISLWNKIRAIGKKFRMHEAEKMKSLVINRQLKFYNRVLT